ncbi:type II secretion system protein GspD [Chakrabartia godavariana]|nr:type II secretion system protein GspD [Chakrabartia godavariana]
MKRVALGLMLALSAVGPVLAQTTLNLRDADVRAFIQDAARVTGRNFVIDGRVQGKVTVVSDRPLSRSEYFEVFLSTLRANGLVAVPTANGAYRIQPADTAAAQPGKIGLSGAARNQFVTEVFRLRAIDAASAVETLRPLVSREGSVTANRGANSLVVADYADNIRRIRTLIQRIDSDGAATELIALKNANARELATSLQQLVAGSSSGGENARGAIAIVAVDSSNSLALRGDRGSVSRFAAMARDLDRRAASGAEVRVIWLQHADAAKLLPVLQQIVGQSVTPAASEGNTPSPAPASAGATATPVASTSGGGGRNAPVIARYEGANAIIISAPSDMQRTLGDVVRQLDTRREQVLVEAIIVEISDTAARKLGVQFLLGGKPGSNIPFAATNYSNAAPNILTIAGAVAARELNTTTTTVNGTTTTTTTNNPVSDQLAQAAVNSVLGAAGAFGGFATNVGNNGIFGAIINAVQQDNKSNILSTPSVVTLDNQEAKILVGQEVPITTGEKLGNNFDNAFRTVQRQNVGIQLEVKPQVNEGDAIKLFIRQEVSSIAGPVTNNGSDLILNKREIQTTVTVDDGQIVALGGLLDDNERRTIEKIPLLGDIPALGQLFRSRAKSREKTNLMVFIRPTILRSADDARKLAERRYGYIRGQQLMLRPNEEPSIDELVRDYMGADLPLPAEAPSAATPDAPAPSSEGPKN